MSIGTTVAILALFGKVEVLILLLMAIDSGSAKMSDASLTSLVGILSIPGAFLEFRDFRMVLISLGVILEPQLEDCILKTKQLILMLILPTMMLLNYSSIRLN